MNANHNAKDTKIEKDNSSEIVPNPNPRANENITFSQNAPDDKDRLSDVGSEITDGEDA